ncbi:glycosyl hydrolase 115 family protein [Eubacterium sp.]|uniref:glycosyl hydrolase 115 family protein n=1 Tax=Eubacterium sp. TaxID=142586 RepID=UPI002589FF2A|nr:glycosyl hydrolase 115 family protein [Eubacterium sp.]MCR5367730.1 glycosyl hydrolase 115 family protein [Eubacterium sp.]
MEKMDIVRGNVVFIYEKCCSSGIKMIADKVRGDISKVFGDMPEVIECSGEINPDNSRINIFFGQVGESEALKKLILDKTIDVTEIENKREVYGFFVCPEKNMIIIAGSDKRGTIYGLFHISDCLGVSPLVNWSLVQPKKRDSFTFSKEDEFISKEPSVEYRGFFINDEWPCFGNWCMSHFGGVNAEMYEQVFELLLRMKGNYMWPAMWASCFAEDGPGLLSAELADKLGVVMGLSHHEPCLRHGEEYSHVRGKDSIYGDAWNFRTNKEGITRFWRDGLKRNGHLENVITVGMRGERDSTILGREATLKDNIDLLRDVLKTQNQLIREEVNPDLDKVPRMIALYKEVEAYYYGDKDTEGLKTSEDLDNIILMLCDDNHGYVRSLPDEEMRRHKGGFGMYYHFDYHGDPISYEWINSTYLPLVREEMSTAYEHGVKKLWIVNVGDLGLQEMPLSYFMSLAYDFDKWSGADKEKLYLRDWMEMQFGCAFSEKELDCLTDIYNRYTRLINNRKPEHMGENVYHPQNYYESLKVLHEAEEIEELCRSLEEKCPKEYKDAYVELISYNILGGMNLVKMWIYRGFNHYFASIGACVANDFGDNVKRALSIDEDLKEKLHSAADGKWNGFGLAPHIGFKNWNSEEAANPVIETVIPVKGPKLVAGLVGEKGSSAGMEWTGKKLYIKEFFEGNGLNDKQSAKIFVALTGDEKTDYKIITSSKCITVSEEEGYVSPDKSLSYITLSVDKKMYDEKDGYPTVSVIYAEGKIDFVVMPDVISDDILSEAEKIKADKKLDNICFAKKGIAVLDAEHFAYQKFRGSNKFITVNDLGRRENAVKLSDTVGKADAELGYAFYITEPGKYDITFQLLPTHAFSFGKDIKFAYGINEESTVELDIISEDFKEGVVNKWSEEVLSHTRLVHCKAGLNKGLNIVRFYGVSSENVLERIILVKEDKELLPSYLGPDESEVL